MKRYKHISRRKLQHDGYKIDSKRHTGAIKPRPSHGVLPPAPRRAVAPAAVLNYPT